MPLYEHDCDNCRFLGIFANKYDLYICEKKPRNEYVIRCSSESSDYRSQMTI